MICSFSSRALTIPSCTLFTDWISAGLNSFSGNLLTKSKAIHATWKKDQLKKVLDILQAATNSKAGSVYEHKPRTRLVGFLGRPALKVAFSKTTFELR